MLTHAQGVVIGFLLLGLAAGCAGMQQAGRQVTAAVTPTDVRLMKHHVETSFDLLESFTTRLYAKNPKYEPDAEQRRRKIARLFQGGPPVENHFIRLPSHQVLAAAFSPEPENPDRVYLLALGLAKSILEAYGLEESRILWPGVRVKLEHLQRLHYNISQANWRLKTYRDQQGELLFLTNAIGEDGYFNMGYEVIMTRILTHIETDIFILGGLPAKYAFSMSAAFTGIIM